MRLFHLVRSTAVVCAVVITLGAVSTDRAMAAKTAAAPSVSFARVDLTTGTSSGVALTRSGALVLASRGLASGTYVDPYGYGTIAESSGNWTAASRSVPFAFDELVASWNASTPAGTWITVEMQAAGSGRTTKWYTLGIWSSGDTTIHRTSVGGQGDADGFVAIDTFIRDGKALPLDSYTLRVTLHRLAGSSETPTLRTLGAMTSAASSYAIPSGFTLGHEVDIAVPQYSQEIHTGEFPEYDGGGEAWCSPTSTSMVLAYWGSGPTRSDLATWPEALAYADPQVDYAARYVYDYHYQGAGNWPFNAAYAASFSNMSGFVTRLRSLAEAERFIAADIPLVASIQGKLTGSYFRKTNGHLLVIRGFTANGDVISNDPASPSDAAVRLVYDRANFEDVWLNGSGGIVYVIVPSGRALPANVAGLPNNW